MELSADFNKPLKALDYPNTHVDFEEVDLYNDHLDQDTAPEDFADDPIDGQKPKLQFNDKKTSVAIEDYYVLGDFD